MANAVAYVRYSSDMQDGHSSDTQFSKMDEVAQENGDVFVARFKDEGVSGRTSERDQFMQMFRAIKSGELKVSKIYVYKFSRFMRDPQDSIFSKIDWRRSASPSSLRQNCCLKINAWLHSWSV